MIRYISKIIVSLFTHLETNDIVYLLEVTFLTKTLKMLRAECLSTHEEGWFWAGKCIHHLTICYKNTTPALNNLSFALLWPSKRYSRALLKMTKVILLEYALESRFPNGSAPHTIRTQKRLISSAHKSETQCKHSFLINVKYKSYWISDLQQMGITKRSYAMITNTRAITRCSHVTFKVQVSGSWKSPMNHFEPNKTYVNNESTDIDPLSVDMAEGLAICKDDSS